MKTFWIIYSIIAIILMLFLSIAVTRDRVKNKEYKFWWEPVITISTGLVSGLLWPLYIIFDVIVIVRSKRRGETI